MAQVSKEKAGLIGASLDIKSFPKVNIIYDDN
jgi:hypothetical protein